MNSVDNWSNIKDGEKTKSATGLLRLRGKPFAKVEVTAEGCKQTVYTDAKGQYRSKIVGQAEVTLEGGGLIYQPHQPTFKSEGEKYTNISRRPSESGNLLEVTKGLRQMQLMQMQFRREQAQASAELDRKRQALEEQMNAETEPAQTEPAQTEPAQTEPAKKPEEKQAEKKTA